jgi:HIV Tat-specific factor 1
LPGSGAAGGNEARIVVLEKMFTLAELAAEPTLLLDLKEDVREECEGFGKVTNCTLWDVSFARAAEREEERG